MIVLKRNLGFLVVALALGLVGCGSGAGSSDSGGLTNEGGVTPPGDGGDSDSGMVSDDAGVDLDGDLPGDDAGRVREDAGVMSDGGPMVDAGPVTDDAGLGMDASLMFDASAPMIDAGSDAGVDAGFDAGPPAMCATDRDCLPRVACTSPTRLTTQTYACRGGFCIENPPSSVNCDAGDTDICAGNSVVAVRGTCDGPTQACVTNRRSAACAAPLCDAASDYVTESCFESASGASCVPALMSCRAGVSVSCSSATLRRTTRGCDATASGCTTTTRNTTCTAGASECQPNIRTRLTDHVVYAPACNAGGTGCLSGGVVDSRTACLWRRAECAGGTLTRYGTTCDPSTGCANPPTDSTCPTSDATCARVDTDLIYTSYTPSCSSATTCSSTGTAVPTTCTDAAPRCERDSYVLSRASCSVAGGCGQATRTIDCNASDASSCSSSTWSFTNGVCGGRGCQDYSGTISCRAGGSACTSSNTYVTCTGGGFCSRGRCTSCTTVTCPFRTPICGTDVDGNAQCQRLRAIPVPI